MKSIKIITGIAFVSTILMGCGEREKTENNHNAGLDLEAVLSKKSSDVDAKGDNTCLLDYQEKYDQLLSEADIITATGFSTANLETNYSKVLKNPEYHGFKFKFKNGRIGKIAALNRELELPDVIEIRSIKPMSLTMFNQSYRIIGDEEMEVAKDLLNEVADGNAGDADAEKAVEEAKKLGVDKEQVKKTGGMMMDAFKDVAKGYKAVNGLGDAATWNVVTKELIVLQSGVQFVIFSEISNDNEKNKTVAIKLAEIILNKCK